MERKDIGYTGKTNMKRRKTPSRARKFDSNELCIIILITIDILLSPTDKGGGD